MLAYKHMLLCYLYTIDKQYTCMKTTPAYKQAVTVYHNPKCSTKLIEKMPKKTIKNFLWYKLRSKRFNGIYNGSYVNGLQIQKSQMKPLGILVNLSCTFSSFSISPSKKGFQICVAYSSCGLTKETYKLLKIFESLNTKAILNIQIILFTLLTIVFVFLSFKVFCHQDTQIPL